MKFPTMFRRFKGSVPAGEIALGADPDPTTLGEDARTLTNVMPSRFANAMGWPVHRVAVAYGAKQGGAPDLPAQMWMFEESLGLWMKIGVSQNLKVNTITFFDVVALLDLPVAQKNLTAPGSGSVQQMLVVGDNAAPDGEYDFAMGPDLTTTP